MMATETEHQERRIERLEENVQAISQTSVANGVKLDYVSTQIDNLCGDLTARLDRITKEVSVGSQRLTLLEKLEEDRRKKWSGYRKLALAMLLAAGGAFGRILVDIVRAAG